MSDPRFEIENEPVKHLLREIGDMLKGAMPEGYGFTLLIFGYHENPDLFYISSARRDDMLSTMLEFMKKITETEHDTKHKH